MGKLVSEVEAHSILRKHFQTIYGVMNESIQSLNVILGASDESLSKSVKAQTFHNLAIEKANKAFKGTQGVNVVKKYNSIMIVFDQKLVARVKKINGKDLSSNNSTKRSNKVSDHTLKLLNLPDLTFIDLGYNTDETWTEFERLKVVCRIKNDIQWRIPFNENDLEITLKTDTINLDIKPEKQIVVKRKANGND